jgi:hypothetical protein
MNEDNQPPEYRYTKKALEWRRDFVFQKLSIGWSQADIAKKLELDPSTISLDAQFLREKSKIDLESHLSEGLPFMFAKSLEGINTVLKRVSEILESAADNKTKMECLKLQMELYRSLMSMTTDGGLIRKAIEMTMTKVIAPLPGEEITSVKSDKMSNSEQEEEAEEDVKEEE